MRALGVDVSLSRGLDVVGLDGALKLVFRPLKTSLTELAAVIADVRPEVIAIDSPPAWSCGGRSRLIERQLMGVGIQVFSTPADPGDHSFYRWMKIGFEVFTLVAGLGYPVYKPGRKLGRCAIEVFPHASGVVLRGKLPRRGLGKRVWRREVLDISGVDTRPLRSPDYLDAALAAMTGIHFARGEFCVVGDPDEAVLVLPIVELPTSRYQRDAPELPGGVGHRA